MQQISEKIIAFFLSPLFAGVCATGSEYPERKKQKGVSELIFSLCFSGFLLILKSQNAKMTLQQKFQNVTGWALTGILWRDASSPVDRSSKYSQ